MSKIWELVKQCEEDLDGKSREFGEMVATLIANYSELNKGRHPVIISSCDKPVAMLVKVLEYYHRDAIEFAEWIRTFDALEKKGGYWVAESQISSKELYNHFKKK